MAVQPQYLAYILEQLAGLGAMRSNRMFGGVGLYCDGLFFGLIDDDTLFFKTNDDNVAPYRERKMPRFMPFPDRPDAALGYHQVPAEVIEEAETLVEWARKAVAVALAAQARKPRPLKPGGGRPKAKSAIISRPRAKPRAPAQRRRSAAPRRPK